MTNSMSKLNFRFARYPHGGVGPKTTKTPRPTSVQTGQPGLEDNCKPRLFTSQDMVPQCLPGGAWWQHGAMATATVARLV